jgi:hypothetical protein
LRAVKHGVQFCHPGNERSSQYTCFALLYALPHHFKAVRRQIVGFVAEARSQQIQISPSSYCPRQQKSLYSERSVVRSDGPKIVIHRAIASDLGGKIGKAERIHINSPWAMLRSARRSEASSAKTDVLPAPMVPVIISKDTVTTPIPFHHAIAADKRDMPLSKQLNPQ